MTRRVAIIGGGLSGAAAAIHLARAGRDVVLLERTTGPHDKVCGEFLSFEAQDELQDLGLDLLALGAVPVQGVSIDCGRYRSATPLPFEGLSLSRRVLDEALLAQAALQGAEIRRGSRVASTEKDGAGWAVRSAEGLVLSASDVMLATGKHDLRGWGRAEGPQADLIGFKMYFRPAEPQRLGGKVELHLFPGGYAGLQPVEGGRANLCLVIRKTRFADLGSNWGTLLSHLLATCPALAVQLDSATACLAKPLAISGIPYGLVQARSDGVWRLGDQAAVIPSFTGEGMSIALHSARVAAAHIIAGHSPQAFQGGLARDLRGQVRRSTLVSKALVSSLPHILLAPFLIPPVLRLVLRATRLPEQVRTRSSSST